MSNAWRTLEENELMQWPTLQNSNLQNMGWELNQWDAYLVVLATGGLSGLGEPVVPVLVVDAVAGLEAGARVKDV